ncbi:Sulfoxide reductase catalytic subunit yedY precursor [Blastochloris viridis]|uniref:Sulfoxide reductase catalytic subunit yedY n=1 Tax=Blastochloris viridis TaxID=1079 RepID=A0A0S4Q1F4_BLAVI|nr:Sulfoxide reductase catalytic subunit yedY precursor [Blastochloris viridis]
MLPDSAAAPERTFLNRRALLAGLAGGATLATPAAADWLDIFRSKPAPPPGPDPTAGLYPVPRNDAYQLDRPLTPEDVVVGNVNFYEFSSDKPTAARLAQRMDIRPWTVKIDGLVEAETTVDIDALIRRFALEERTYRHRCVEAWSIAVPWSGFAMSKLIEFAKPLPAARYVRFETFGNASWAPGQKQSWYPWPYADAFTMAECANELAFMATGAYGKPLNRANGSPLRAILPWKYGFKQPKAIVRVSFLDARPKGFWERVQGFEYGFWANVNPEVPHPRWSQARERDLATGEMRPTQIFNGYGRYVAHLYEGKEGERLFM